jgi:hypothetical protein
MQGAGGIYTPQDAIARPASSPIPPFDSYAHFFSRSPDSVDGNCDPTRYSRSSVESENSRENASDQPHAITIGGGSINDGETKSELTEQRDRYSLNFDRSNEECRSCTGEIGETGLPLFGEAPLEDELISHAYSAHVPIDGEGLGPSAADNASFSIDVNPIEIGQ